VKKELRPFHDHVTCDVCGRTILKGERTEAYLVQGGQNQTVCELCFGRAEQAGWIRESAHGDVPARGPRPQERRPLLGRLRRRASEPADEPQPAEPQYAEAPAAEAEPAVEPEPEPPRQEAAPSRTRRHDPRHVRAVPTTAEVKVERALDLFNSSEHQRTIAGLARSLGAPYAAAMPDIDAPSTVSLIVAWELSWYRFRIDLGDAADPVGLAAKGDELDDIDEELRNWNAGLDAEGRLVIGVAQQ
jgi:hypothetical protein